MANPFLSCVHTHTHFCDGKDAPEVTVKKALELGFVSLGFSSHAPSRWDYVAMTEETLAQYIAEINRLQQVYDGQLEILLGIERELDGDPLPEDVFEYSIESVHSLHFGDEICFIDWSLEKTQDGVQKFFGGEIYTYAEAYFAACAKQYEKSKAQIAGHIDLLTKFNESAPLIDETNPRYRKALFEAIDTGLERGLVFEVNSGAISRGYRTTPYPAPFICWRRKRRWWSPVTATMPGIWTAIMRRSQSCCGPSVSRAPCGCERAVGKKSDCKNKQFVNNEAERLTCFVHRITITEERSGCL